MNTATSYEECKRMALTEFVDYYSELEAELERTERAREGKSGG